MAYENANDYDYRLVNDETGLKDAISELKGKIAERNTLLAVDCEGDSLSRKGALTIITVATEEKAYIFDVLKLGQLVFSSGLGEILEDKSREKLTFDCRQDSDALWHQFKVKLSGVLDLQLLEVIYRRENPAADSTVNTPRFSTTNKRGGRRNRRSQRTDEVEKIYGFGRCIELYLQDEKLVKMKDKGKELLKEDNEVWTKRPLTDDLIQYCIVDTMAMFRLYSKMKDVNGGEQARLRVASEKYVDLYRGKTERSFDDYETNAYLPLDIIPDKGTLDFPAANTECTRCHRRFPREEFSITQLGKGEQKCRVCKEIKRLEDVQQNRVDNWERAAQEEEEYVYIPEGMSDYAWVHGHEPWENSDDDNPYYW
ncbi:piRNA biogenesis protein EXD1-like [Orbicella faveolata]|uniref:piRNA biogenesis protein EXD1-like n=1 Tax=Orbicella faveolata TaxID=48498 RepID=UPI0009E35831|nr:piRNA biogenesis protein EXD1-like [Orbicella faveolata]